MAPRRIRDELPLERRAVPYPSREFCNSICCTIQIELNRHDSSSEVYNDLKKVCREACQYSGTVFREWLKKEGYHSKGEEALKDRADSLSAYDYHQLLKAHGIEMVRYIL